MKFEITVQDVAGTREPWKEAMDKPDVTNEESAIRVANRIIDRFNATLRPHEKACKRQLLIS